MRPSASHLLLITVPPVAASFAILAMGDVGKGVWMMHLAAICLAGALAFAGNQFLRLARLRAPALAIIILTLVGVAVPLLRDSSGPNRWASLGPLNLYMASLFLPSFVAACSVYSAKRGKHSTIAVAAALGVSTLLAIQPDASQVLALLVGLTVGFLHYRSDKFRSAITLLAIALVTAWSFSRPDPLAPVPHVEGVFALALGYSLLAGLAVIGSAIALVSGLLYYSLKGPLWLSAVAAYYSVLFGCSVAGLTPAPLIGYGAGPLLGFGLLVAVSGSIEAERSSIQ
ncbi:MAG: hypothetical protein ABL931_11855 [Usitatibacteraceae bacterium]